jgi:nicotinamidase-related amidase
MDSLPEILHPSHTSLIMVDMQNDFVSGEGSLACAGNSVAAVQKMLPTLRYLLGHARELNILVVHLQYSTLPGYLTDSDSWLYYNLHDIATPDMCVRGSWGEEFVEGLEPMPDELVVTKHRSSGFVNTALDQVLRSNRIRTVVVAGVQTPGCVEATFRDAAYHDYYNVLAEDCVAAYRQEEHEASLLVQRARHTVLRADEIVAIWRAGSGTPSPPSSAATSDASARAQSATMSPLRGAALRHDDAA